MIFYKGALYKLRKKQKKKKPRGGHLFLLYLGVVHLWRFCLNLRNSASWNECSDVFWLWDRINVLRESDVFASVSALNKNRRGFKLLRKLTNFLKVDAFVRTDFFPRYRFTSKLVFSANLGHYIRSDQCVSVCFWFFSHLGLCKLCVKLIDRTWLCFMTSG